MRVPDLATAIAASETAYSLLLWIGARIEDGGISVDDATAVLSSPEAALKFLASHRSSLPDGLQPLADQPEVANILGSYFKVSFQIGEDRPIPDPVCGPSCPWCWTLKRGPHLTPLKASAEHRKAARRRSAEQIAILATGAGVQISEKQLPSVAERAKRDVGMVAYGDALRRRAAGGRAGPEMMVLWRTFAWSGGSPDHSFRLTLAGVEGARERILYAIKETQGIDDR